jgi:hypothetical protein
MEHAKKLILIEPRVLEQLQSHTQYKELEKPIDKKTKANMSVELQQMLEGDGVSDDLKAKLFQQTFSKFRSMRNQIPQTDKVDINALTTPLVPRALRRAQQQQQQQQQTPRRKTTGRRRKQTRAAAWDQY